MFLFVDKDFRFAVSLCRQKQTSYIKSNDSNRLSLALKQFKSSNLTIHMFMIKYLILKHLNIIKLLHISHSIG